MRKQKDYNIDSGKKLEVSNCRGRRGMLSALELSLRQGCQQIAIMFMFSIFDKVKVIRDGFIPYYMPSI
jgi:hypothetical protein